MSHDTLFTCTLLNIYNSSCNKNVYHNINVDIYFCFCGRDALLKIQTNREHFKACLCLYCVNVSMYDPMHMAIQFWSFWWLYFLHTGI